MSIAGGSEYDFIKTLKTIPKQVVCLLDFKVFRFKNDICSQQQSQIANNFKFYSGFS